MKKFTLIISLILVIAAFGAVFTACSNATPQGQIADIFGGGSPHVKEVFDYQITVGSGDNATFGTYHVELEKFSKGSQVEFGDKTLENVNEGVRISGRVEYQNKVIETLCYYDVKQGRNYLIPRHTYRKETLNGEVYHSMSGEYSGNKLLYTALINGNTQTGELSCGALYYDNNEFHQTLRGLTTMSASFSYSFTVPVVRNEIAVTSLTASARGTEKIKTPYTESAPKYQEEGIECYAVALSRATEVAGISQQLYYATGDVLYAADNPNPETGWKVPHILVKIVEKDKINGEVVDVVYELTSFSIA